MAGVLVEFVSYATGGAGCKGINWGTWYYRHRDTVCHRKIQASCHRHDGWYEGRVSKQEFQDPNLIRNK